MQTELSIKETLSLAWGWVKKHFIVMVGLAVGYMAIASLISWLFIGGHGVLMGFIGKVASAFLSYLFWLGYTQIGLDVVDGKEPSFDTFQRVLPRVWNYLICGILMFVPICIGLGLLVVPGVYLLSRWMFATYFILEGEGPIDSLRKSWALTRGHGFEVCLLTFMFFLLAVVGIACCFVGVFVAIAWIILAEAVAYRKLQVEG